MKKLIAIAAMALSLSAFAAVEVNTSGLTDAQKAELVKQAEAMKMTSKPEAQLVEKVDTSKNELVKCRQSLDDVLGAAFNIKPLVQDPERVVESLINLRNELLGRCDGNPALQEIVMKMNSCLHRKYPIHG